ncbi:HpcH/HpaI aldolase family protein [Rhizomonospora bruguierae]|uniref:HpcH/HpaI aldolase family protein n=1 Tax=Rhizomonospora bruguierae TaxID=1581705 RepID=UPI001BD0A6B9|nr:aldolase/citrate lyase family protein [Micromonospora sp. NBRC 107566]
MTIQSALRQKWAVGQPAFGAWLTIPSITMTELVGEIGWDYVCLDSQHGFFDYADVLGALVSLRTSRSDVLVRVPSSDQAAIGKVLDAGANGVVVPMVETAEQAEAVARACRYAPRGVRSYGPIRAARLHRTRDPALLGDALCIVMIETPTGIANLEQICAVDGVDAVYVGPADLAVAMGLPPGLKRPEPEHRAGLRTVAEVTNGVGTPAGIQCDNERDGIAQIAAGYRFATVWKDTAAILGSATASWRAVGGGVSGGDLLSGYM